MADPDRLAFDFELLLHAAEQTRPMTVCEQGHLVVAGRTHWAAERVSIDLKSLVMTLVDTCTPQED